MDSNAKTLATYSEHFSNYVEGTAQVVSGFQEEWLEYLLSLGDEESRILEVGSAFGRDASFIVEKGFKNLLATDAFDVAVDALRKRGLRAQKLNLLTDRIEGEYDLTIASAVFLHFTLTEFMDVLTKIKTSLSEEGKLGFSVKNGTGEEWSDAKMGAPRFFHYWSEGELRQALASLCYSIVDFRHSDDDKWLHVTCEAA